MNDGVLNLILAYGYSFSRAGLIYSLMEYSSTEYAYRVEDELNKHHIKFLKRLLSHIKDSSERENLIKEIGSEIGWLVSQTMFSMKENPDMVVSFSVDRFCEKIHINNYNLSDRAIEALNREMDTLIHYSKEDCQKYGLL